MKYKSKNTGDIVEAFQYDGDFSNSSGEYYIPQWAIELYENETLFFSRDELYYFHFETLEEILIPVGSYILLFQREYEEIFFCNPEVFESNYERLMSKNLILISFIVYIEDYVGGGAIEGMFYTDIDSTNEEIEEEIFDNIVENHDIEGATIEEIHFARGQNI